MIVGEQYISISSGLIVEYIGNGSCKNSFTGKVISIGDSYFHIGQTINFFACEKFRELYQIYNKNKNK